MQITEEEYKRLKEDSLMLGQIACYVEDFCEDSEYTTLMAVMALLADYYYLKSDDVHQQLQKLQNNRY